MKDTLNKNFTSKFNTDPEFFVKAPGRINLIGEHTDYNEGFVLPAAIDKYILFAIAHSPNENYNIYSLDFEDSAKIKAKNLQLQSETSWIKYFEAVLIQFNLRSHFSLPFNCAFSGNIPKGGGMSSSAALCCGFAYALCELNDWKFTRKQLVLMCQAAEHSVGIMCGVMDQFASLFGKNGQVMLLDCKSMETNHFPLELGNYSLCLINSMQIHEFATDSEYNERRISCEKVVKILQPKYGEVSSLRDVTLAMLESAKDEIEPIAYQRALYVVHENARVLAFVKALQSGNIAELGPLLKAAQHGMKTQYEITTKEIDFLADTLNSNPKVLGARMMGGGFGGCVLALVETQVIEDTVNSVLETYKAQFNRLGEVYFLSLADGVNVI